MRMIGKIKQEIKKRARNSNPKSKAQGLLEFALILPILLLLIFGVMEFGRMLFIYSAVFTATREAARYGSAAGKVDGTPRYNDCVGIRARAIQIGSIAGIRDDDISIRYDSGPGTPILEGSSCPYNEEEGKVKVREGYHRIIVEINKDFTPMVPLVNVPPAVIHSRSARTIMSDISVKVDITPIPPPAQDAMYVAALSGTSSFNDNGTWKADITITVKDKYGDPIQGVTVIGVFSVEDEDYNHPPQLCITDYWGKCTQSSGDINPSNEKINYTVTNLIHEYYEWDSSLEYSIEVGKPDVE
jgi:hypothetical protein